MRALLLTLLLLATPASAASFAVNAGALEVLGLPLSHQGFYPYLGGSVAFTPSPAVTLIAALSFEWSFDQGRGGFVLGGTADFPLTTWLGLDANLTLIQDMPGADFSRSDLFLGVGPGVSFFVGKWAFSPFVGLFGRLTGGGWSVVPGVNVAFAP